MALLRGDSKAISDVSAGRRPAEIASKGNVRREKEAPRIADAKAGASKAGGAEVRDGKVGNKKSPDAMPKPILPPDASVQTHRVKRGETLGQIAAYYGTEEAVLMGLNGLVSGESIRVGQILFVPGRGKSAMVRKETSSAAWRRYARVPEEKGRLVLSTHMARFAGAVLEKDGRLIPSAVRTLNGMLGTGGKHRPLPERLIRLLVQISDVFGGRPIHVVSGYRTNSYYQDSRHPLSAAVDFTISGVPNAVLCEYLRELEAVGVGYYPNSTFVHLDVRNESAYWVDYAGPGEPPRSSPNAPRRNHQWKRKLLAELDEAAESTKKAMTSPEVHSLLDATAPIPPLPEASGAAEEPSGAVDEPSAASRDGGADSEPTAQARNP